ncbi:MAG: hypothetical protein QM796_15220 [Chthoniobacteraceae bacterium]
MKSLLAFLLALALGVVAYHEYTRAEDLQAQVNDLSEQLNRLKAAPKKSNWLDQKHDDPFHSHGLDTAQ